MPTWLENVALASNWGMADMLPWNETWVNYQCISLQSIDGHFIGDADISVGRGLGRARASSGNNAFIVDLSKEVSFPAPWLF